MLPPPLSEASLLAYLDGEADLDVAEHLARCPHCRSRAAALDAEERPIRALLFRVDCPAPDAWRDYYFGLLSDDLSAPMTDHLHGCPYCARELLILQSFVPLVEPNSMTGPSPLLGGLQWWVARLLPGLPTACQHPCAARKQSWTYLAGEMQVKIDGESMLSQPDRRLLKGRLFTDQLLGWTAYLWRRSRLVATARTNALGAFQFARLPAHRYEMTLAGPHARVYLPKLILR